MLPSDRARVAVTLRGVVQGVGMRPTVHVLAQRFGLGGFVRNEVSRVLIEVEGELGAVEAFLEALKASPPPLARIDEWLTEPRDPTGDRQFLIVESAGASSESPIIAPDTACCAECLSELLDPSDRRYRHPFANCTACGPRLTIVTGAPYDRAKTTMASFELCADCRAEYDSPEDRRFHAQPVACSRCGPQLSLRLPNGAALAVDDPLLGAAERLISGQIGAIKGIGGYHLACDATSSASVRELRRRKRRDAKPFALLVRDVAQAAELCELGETERRLLEERAAPIVLLRRRPRSAVAPEVAPELDQLGLMLPQSPLHHLLARAVDRPLVLTSGNVSDEPMAYEDADALHQLGNIADFFLVHDRRIQLRVDDSVARVIDDAAVPLRRSRGYAPLPLALPEPLSRPTLALGGHLKNTFSLGAGKRATLSPHIGDLDELAAHEALRATVALYERLFGVRPERVVHDLHPDYATTRLAATLAAEGLTSVGVQHHHAHVAACIAEHGIEGPVIGVAFDGSGYATDGTLWGGEFLVGTAHSVERLAHLIELPLPGGDRAARQGWRMAAVQAQSAGIDPAATRIADAVPIERIRAIERIAERGEAVATSSVGRLFDAVAALAGVAFESRFEGDAAMRLEACALGGIAAAGSGYDIEIAKSGETWLLDPRPLILAVVRDEQSAVSRDRIAARFHLGLADCIARVAALIRDATAIETVVLTGGVFCNALLTHLTRKRLAEMGFDVRAHRLVPPNDGGLCFGQLAVVAARDRAG